MNLDATRPNSSVDGKRTWHVSGGKNGYANNAYQAEHDALFDAIRNDKPYNEAEYGATSTMTAILGRMATYSGQDREMGRRLSIEPFDDDRRREMGRRRAGQPRWRRPICRSPSRRDESRLRQRPRFEARSASKAMASR